MNPARLMTSTVWVAAPAGPLDGFGVPTYAEAVAVKARVRKGEARDDSGTEATAERVDIIITLTAIPAGARVWLDEGDVSDTKKARRPTLSKESPHPTAPLTLYRYEL